MTMSRLLFVLSLAALAACDAPPLDATPVPVGNLESPIRVPGRWAPPADIIAIANAQFVPVVDPPPVQPGGQCAGPDLHRDWCQHPACTRAHAGTTEIAAYILRRWPTTINAGVYGCRRNTNNGAFLSVHAVGRAIDISVPLAQGDADNTLGDEIGNWLMANAAHIGIQRVGWDGMWFNGERGFGSRMCQRNCGDADYPAGCWPCNPHVDHLHIEVSVDAANRRTRFFSQGPPGETCPIVCYGNAAVREDCSFEDCAAAGQVCMGDPVRCVDAEPPEPPLASNDPEAELPAVSPIGPPTRFSFVGPERVFDTRPDADDARLIRQGTGPLAPGTIATVEDFPGVGEGARGVWLNVAATQGAGPGFVRVYPSGPAPEPSSLNFAEGFVQNNAVPVTFGQQGGVDFLVSRNEVHLLADVYAAFTEAGLGLRSVAPRRVIDTRDTPAPVEAMTPLVVDVGAPEGAAGVAASVAVLNGEQGHIRVYACGDPLPESSAINYAGRGTVANTLVSRLSAEGELCLWSTSPVELIVDVTGYFVPDGELSYQPVEPVRLLDTREEGSLYQGRVGDGQTIELPIQSLTGAPEGIRSAVLNLTAVQSDERGHLTVFPCGFEAPLTSALNFGEERGAVAAIAQSSIGDGTLCIRAHNRTHLIADLLGVWVPTPGADPPTAPAPPDEPDPAIPAEPDGGAADAGATVDTGPDADRADVLGERPAVDHGFPDDLTVDQGFPGDSADSEGPKGDAGASQTDDTDTGCACGATDGAPSPLHALLAFALLLFRNGRAGRAKSS